MRAALLVAFLLAGCVQAEPEVHVSIDNRTGQAHPFEVVVWWDAEDPVQRGRATGTIDANTREGLFSFHAPCDEGRWVYVGVLANGTSTLFEQEWGDGCSEQSVSFILEPPRARFLVD